MATTVKVCGVRDRVGLDACVEAGADFVGFNFAPGSARRVDVDVARELVAAIPDGGPVAVGVFADQMPGDVMRIARAVGIEVVQLHGSESPAYCSAIGGFRVWKAVRQPGMDRATLEAFAAWCDGLVVDGRDAGSGEAWDYGRLRPLLDDDGTVTGAPVLVAGGLTSDTVADALRRSGAAGADVASGVERGEAGARVVDPTKVAAFVAAARGGQR